MSLISTDLSWGRKDEYEDDDLLRFFLVGADRKTRWWFGGPGSPVRLNVPPTGLQGAPGSSPLTRGGPEAIAVLKQAGGLIPAYAGRTTSMVWFMRCVPAHPRLRGADHILQ